MSQVEVSDARAHALDDEALARRAAARDPAAWSEIFERHYPAVFAFARFRLRGLDQAEDVAARAFEVAYTNAGRFDWRGTPIEGWLIGIVRNLCRDEIKKLARRGIHTGLDETFAPPAPDEVAGSELRHDLLQAMRDLTEDQRTVIQLRFLLDRSVAETAVLMARSEDAVKNLQRRALAAMARAYDTPSKEARP